MSQTIDRIFESVTVASDAVKKLTSLGFRIHDIHLVTPAAADQGEGEDGKLEAVMAAIMKGMVPKAKARVFANAIVAGGSLVTVHAPFGFAQLAIDTLDEFGPIPSGFAEPSDKPPAWSEATPLSCAFMLPVLSSDPTPFETFSGLPTLTSAGASFSKWFGLPMLSRVAAPLSRLFGLPTLSRNPAPFSSLFRIPLLKAGR